MKKPQSNRDETKQAPMNKRLLILMIILPLIGGLGYIGSKLRTPKDGPGTMKILEFGQLPLVYAGRKKPFDTLARNNLMLLSGKQTFIDDKGKKQPAIRWLLDVISLSPAADKPRQC